MTNPVKLTQYSHGAGCGCKISPKVLKEIVGQMDPDPLFPKLLVGNDTNDDAACYAIDDDNAIISTTDFFMPIVDDAFDFGRIAATNAISDVYAMGGKPLMAIAILGWPTSKLSSAIAHEVISGGRETCRKANIPLAGGHSIDSPEPIFGLAVTGIVNQKRLKLNSKAQVGDVLFLTKPLGIGIMTTAEKQNKLLREDIGVATETMCRLNDIGTEIAAHPGVHAMTDVTGFGLLGHLTEMCEGSEVSAKLHFDHIPALKNIDHYIAQQCIPGGCARNFSSYGHNVSPLGDFQKTLLCDPQTSGGLLISVSPKHAEQLAKTLKQANCFDRVIGRICEGTGTNNSLPNQGRLISVE